MFLEKCPLHKNANPRLFDEVNSFKTDLIRKAHLLLVKHAGGYLDVTLDDEISGKFFRGTIWVWCFAGYEMGLSSYNLTGDLDFCYVDVSGDAGKIILLCVREKEVYIKGYLCSPLMAPLRFSTLSLNARGRDTFTNERTLLFHLCIALLYSFIYISSILDWCVFASHVLQSFLESLR